MHGISKIENRNNSFDGKEQQHRMRKKCPTLFFGIHFAPIASQESPTAN
jgi:hypothetical protein